MNKFLTFISPANIGKLFDLIGLAMTIVERVKGASGKDKETAVIQSVQEGVPEIESILGLDFVNDAALNALLSDYIAARKALLNGVAAAKGLKPAPVAVTPAV
jgi:hypothetical protein